MLKEDIKLGVVCILVIWLLVAGVYQSYQLAEYVYEHTNLRLEWK